ncbi:MAG: hypothetical protein RIB80_13365 [Rhodospirillales bacterium]
MLVSAGDAEISKGDSESISRSPAMLTRTIKKVVTFNHPFVLDDFDEVLPAGEYKVEVDEELLQSLSFQAFHRVRTVIYLHPKGHDPGNARVLTVNSNALDAALSRDHDATVAAGLPPSRATGNRPAIERGENEGMALQAPPQSNAAAAGGRR